MGSKNDKNVGRVSPGRVSPTDATGKVVRGTNPDNIITQRPNNKFEDRVKELATDQSDLATIKRTPH